MSNDPSVKRFRNIILGHSNTDWSEDSLQDKHPCTTHEETKKAEKKPNFPKTPMKTELPENKSATATPFSTPLLNLTPPMSVTSGLRKIVSTAPKLRFVFSPEFTFGARANSSG